MTYLEMEGHKRTGKGSAKFREDSFPVDVRISQLSLRHELGAVCCNLPGAGSPQLKEEVAGATR